MFSEINCCSTLNTLHMKEFLQDLITTDVHIQGRFTIKFNTVLLKHRILPLIENDKDIKGQENEAMDNA